jgi:hypothetical protein
MQTMAEAGPDMCEADEASSMLCKLNDIMSPSCKVETVTNAEMEHTNGERGTRGNSSISAQGWLLKKIWLESLGSDLSFNVLYFDRNNSGFLHVCGWMYVDGVFWCT